MLPRGVCRDSRGFWPLHPGSTNVLGRTESPLLARGPTCPRGACREQEHGSELKASGCTSWSTRGTYTVCFTSHCIKSREHVGGGVSVCEPLGGGPGASGGHWASFRRWSPHPKMRLCPELGSPGKLGASGVGVKTHWSFFTQVPSGS